jgi:hypothetical protein
MTWGTIVIVIIALWGVISQVLEAAARKAKEKKRQEELASKASRDLDVTVGQPAELGTSFEKRSELPGPAGPTQYSQARTPARTPATVAQPRAARSTFTNRAKPHEEGDLAARRRDQLEQLRQRRASGDLRGTLGSGRAAPAPAPATPPGQRRSKPMAPATRSAKQPQQPPSQTPRPVKAKSVSYRSGRPLESPLESIKSPDAQQGVREIASVARDRQVSIDAYSMPTLAQGHGGATSQAAAVGGANVDALRKLLSDPLSLRQVFLLKEVLDVPVSLRTDPEPGYLAG